MRPLLGQPFQNPNRPTVVLRIAVFLTASLTAAQPLAFDAASFKPATTTNGNSTFNLLPAGIEGTNDSLSMLIRFAYHLQPNQLSGPAWLDTAAFDVIAKASHQATAEELRQMLQSLLAERLKMVVHQEEKQVVSYVLVVDKGGLKIRPVEGTNRNMHGTGHSFEATEAPLSQLAGNLAGLLRRAVVDETNTPGSFTYTLSWSPENQSAAEKGAAAAIPGPTLLEALREQLGLRLEERKIPMQVLVVDHVERRPTEN